MQTLLPVPVAELCEPTLAEVRDATKFKGFYEAEENFEDCDDGTLYQYRAHIADAQGRALFSL